MGVKVKITNDGGRMFVCPGCKRPHMIDNRWQISGSDEAPTFSPSILVNYPANPKASEEFKEWRTDRVCHSFVTDGRIQFLSDCTHNFAGQTVDLPDWGEHHAS